MQVGVGIGDVQAGRRKGSGAWAWMAVEAASLEPPPARLPLTTCALGLRYSGNSPRSDGTRQLNPAPCYGGKMLSLKRPSGASAFYCNRRHRLPFVNLLVCARGERARESGRRRGATEGGDGRRMLIRGPGRAQGCPPPAPLALALPLARPARIP